MQGVSESLAGRTAVLQLLPLSCRETAKVTPFLGGYPEVIARPSAARLWFSSYVQTYLERDVRAVTAVRDLSPERCGPPMRLRCNGWPRRSGSVAIVARGSHRHG